PEAPQKPISLSFWYNLLITACLDYSQIFLLDRRSSYIFPDCPEYWGFLIERKRADLALKYNANKETADA
ncbi:MAG TPA: hypothetical protein PKK94_01155, partial [Leptospiraceae bacterium]|nr:hypothetical protein [Leptospiraceae bacterium]